MKNQILQFDEDFYPILKAIVLTGGLILKAFRGSVDNLPKKSDLPQDSVDKTSTAHTFLDDLVQEVALEILTSQYPKIGINVEEDTERVNRFSLNKRDLCFHLDPLDGTFAYIQGRDDFSIGAAFSRNLEFFASAIYFPAFNRLYYAERRKGIEVMDSSGQNIPFQRKKVPLSFYCQKRCENLIPILQKMELESLDCLSAHHKMIAVAEGNAKIQMCHLASPHDYGIPSVILEEAGGVCSDLSGNPIKYNKNFARLPFFFSFYDKQVKEEFFTLL